MTANRPRHALFFLKQVADLNQLKRNTTWQSHASVYIQEKMQGIKTVHIPLQQQMQ